MQGDPLAVLLFALVLHPVILRIKSEVPTLRINGWFLDDGLLTGTKQEVIKAIQIILKSGPPRGLHLSTEHSVPGDSKSAVWSNQPLHGDPLGLGVKPVTGTGFSHLGAPVGDNDYVVTQIEARVKKNSGSTC